MKFYVALLILLVFLVQPAYALHQVEYRAPPRITTTVGELTNFQLDIRNAGSTVEYYKVTITAVPANNIEITNPSITTKTLNPGESVSVFSNIRTLTESSIALTISIYRDNDLSHAVSVTIPVNSKKLSLPEFNLLGFLQIIAIATILYFLFGKGLRPVNSKSFFGIDFFRNDY